MTTAILEHGVDAIAISNHGGRQLDGVDHTLGLLTESIRRTMALTGCRSIDEITPELVKTGADDVTQRHDRLDHGWSATN